MAEIIEIGRGFRKFILKNRVIIGRNQGAEIRIDDQKVSKLHALIFQKAGEYFLADLGSKNGTLYYPHGKKGEKLESVLKFPAFVSWCSSHFSQEYPPIDIKQTFLTFLDSGSEQPQDIEQLIQNEAYIRHLHSGEEIGIAVCQGSVIPRYRLAFQG